tara:strand:+ start:642 stop:1397 length:756 start_codon:yes stop_codon:yes gene_type:complete
MNIILNEEQNIFEKKLKNNLEIQNKRYRKALNLIEKLYKKNIELENKGENIIKNNKKTKKKNHLNPRNNLNDFKKNKEIIIKIIVINNTLDNVLEFHKKIVEEKYKEKIDKFIRISEQDEESRLILMYSIQIINNFIKQLNFKVGVPQETKYIDIIKIFNKILKKEKMEENFKKLEQIINNFSKLKQQIKHSDLNKLEKNILKIKNSYNLSELNVRDILFDLEKGKKININQLIDKSNDCIEFSQRKNPLI